MGPAGKTPAVPQSKGENIMQIHKGLLTHDGVVGATAGKVLDLGFNGDFDIKNHRWNTVFVAFPANSSATAITLAAKTWFPAEYKTGVAYSANDLVAYKGNAYKVTSAITAVNNTGFDKVVADKLDLAGVSAVFAANAATIGSVTVPAANAKLGGVWGMPMPRGLERYFTLAVTGADATVVTAGITDAVDTDVNPGVDWTYFKADTKGVNQPGAAEEQAGLPARVTALEDAE